MSKCPDLRRHGRGVKVKEHEDVRESSCEHVRPGKDASMGGGATHADVLSNNFEMRHTKGSTLNAAFLLGFRMRSAREDPYRSVESRLASLFGQRVGAAAKCVPVRTFLCRAGAGTGLCVSQRAGWILALNRASGTARDVQPIPSRAPPNNNQKALVRKGVVQMIL